MTVLTTLLAQLGLVLLLAMVLGALAERLRLPAIAGQLLAGVLLGPSLLGALWPRGYGVLFAPHNAQVTATRTDFLEVGLLVFIFFVGLEIDVGLLHARARTIIPVSILGIAFPFALGFASVVAWPILYGRGAGSSLALPLIIAVALSISALPVIAAIITDLGLLRSTVGQLILSAAVVNDLYGWLGFAAVSAAFTHSGSGTPLWAVVLIVLGGFALAVTVGRRLGAFAGTWVEEHVRRASLALGVALAIALLASAAAEGSGAHAFFGALLTGLALSGGHDEFVRPLEKLVRAFFAPLYFGAIGLSINFVANFDLLLCTVVFVIACAGKLLGVWLGARLGGCTSRASLAIATGLNARGAIEILLAVLALASGLIGTRIFEAIVVMALATSILAGFGLQVVLGVRHPTKRPAQERPVLQQIGEGRP